MKGIDAAVGDKLRQIPNVREVIGSLMDMVAFEDQDLFMIIVNGWPSDSPEFEPAHRSVRAAASPPEIIAPLCSAAPWPPI